MFAPDSASNSPFFTNDATGIVKVLLVVVVPTVVSIIAAVWKFMRGDLKDDINGLGTRLGVTESTQTGLNTRVEAIERQRERDDEKFRNLEVGLARVEQQTKQLGEQNTDGKLEILAKLNDMQVRVENRINESNVGMAEMRGEMRAFRQMMGAKQSAERERGQQT